VVNLIPFSKNGNLKYDENVLHFLIEVTGTAKLPEQLLSQGEIGMS
jgi:hypothetical protein